MSEGIKHDQEKVQLDLLSPTWLLGVGRVLTFGAKKYSANNWRGGIARSRLIAACLRHVLAYSGGEDLDPETGLSHLDHASCCLMFASELHHTRPDLDDRYKTPAVDPKTWAALSKAQETIRKDCGEQHSIFERVNRAQVGEGPEDSRIEVPIPSRLELMGPTGNRTWFEFAFTEDQGVRREYLRSLLQRGFIPCKEESPHANR